MKKLFMIIATCLLTGVFSTAQKPRFGFTAGDVFANYTTKLAGETDNADAKTGITAGILVDIPAGKHFSFQPAMNFVQKGTKSEQTSGGTTEKYQITVNSIEVPLNLLYNASGNTGNFFIGAGPSLAFALSGKSKFDDGTISDTEDLKIGNGDGDDLKGLDLGANFMTGYCFPNGLFLSFNYNKGLSNLFPGGSSDFTFKSDYFGVKLGYLLKGKKQPK